MGKTFRYDEESNRNFRRKKKKNKSARINRKSKRSLALDDTQTYTKETFNDTETYEE